MHVFDDDGEEDGNSVENHSEKNVYSELWARVGKILEFPARGRDSSQPEANIFSIGQSQTKTSPVAPPHLPPAFGNPRLRNSTRCLRNTVHDDKEESDFTGLLWGDIEFGSWVGWVGRVGWVGST